MAPRSMSCLTSLLLTVTSLCVVTCHGFRLSSELTKPGRPRREAAEQYVHVSPSPHKVRYGVLLDAGSSSTKVKVYSFTPARSVAGVPHVRLEKSQRERPGLGSFVSAPPGQLREYLDKVLSHATEVVPPAQHATSPVYVMATAGMRVLGAVEAKELLEEVGRVMRNSSINPFVFHQQHVNILSGEEEAVYAWLAVNYLRGFFSEDSPHPPEPVGVLEMGGGSMQVAFLPDTPLYQEEFQMYVGRRRFDLYAQTYLSYGSNYLTEQVRWRLLERQEKQGQVSDMRFHSPCMLSGDTAQFQWENKTYQVLGTGNTSHCEEVLASILAPVDSILCSPGPCTIRDTYQPAVGDHPFFAISAFLYAPRSLKAVEADGVLNITKLRHNARDYCRLTVAQAVQQTGTKAKFASNDCLMGLYIPLLLTSALGFEPNTRTVTVASKINDTSIDWALGAMVQRLSMTFMNDPDSLSSCHLRDHLPENRPVRTQPSSGSCPLTSSLTWMPMAVLILGCTHLISWQ